MQRTLTHLPRHAGGMLAAAVRPTIVATSARLVPAASPQLQRPSRRAYHEKVLDHYSNPRNVGSMGKNDSDVGTGLVGAPACGDVMKLQIRVDPKDNTISDVKFKTFGCGSAIASSSYLTELVRGMTLEQAGRIRNTEIAKELCLPPVKCKFFRVVFSPTESILTSAISALFDAGRRCHQIRNLELLHQESPGQGYRPRDYCCGANAED